MKCDVAFVIRCDSEIREHGFERIVVKTSHGPLERVFVGRVHGVDVAVVYGRHEATRVPSGMINYAKIQEAINKLAVRVIVGSFITGSIHQAARRGVLYVPHDLVGVGGGNKQTLYGSGGFHNIDALELFCPRTRRALLRAATEQSIDLRDRAVYACFHDYPRFETAAELALYESLGFDIVGQTMDPEATLARESACCYAGICVTIDDIEIRQRKARGDHAFCDAEIRRCIDSGRTDMARVMFAALPFIKAEILDARPECPCRTEIHHPGPEWIMRSLPTFEVPFRGVVE